MAVGPVGRENCSSLAVASRKQGPPCLAVRLLSRTLLHQGGGNGNL